MNKPWLRLTKMPGATDVNVAIMSSCPLPSTSPAAITSGLLPSSFTQFVSFSYVQRPLTPKSTMMSSRPLLSRSPTAIISGLGTNPRILMSLYGQPARFERPFRLLEWLHPSHKHVWPNINQTNSSDRWNCPDVLKRGLSLLRWPNLA